MSILRSIFEVSGYLSHQNYFQSLNLLSFIEITIYFLVQPTLVFHELNTKIK